MKRKRSKAKPKPAAEPLTVRDVESQLASRYTGRKVLLDGHAAKIGPSLNRRFGKITRADGAVMVIAVSWLAIGRRMEAGGFFDSREGVPCRA